jgi:hypothetical protein
LEKRRLGNEVSAGRLVPKLTQDQEASSSSRSTHEPDISADRQKMVKNW